MKWGFNFRYERAGGGPTSLTLGQMAIGFISIFIHLNYNTDTSHDVCLLYLILDPQSCSIVEM